MLKGPSLLSALERRGILRRVTGGGRRSAGRAGDLAGKLQRSMDAASASYRDRRLK